MQRTDEDPELYDVIYHGEHTCVHRPAAAVVATAAPAPEHNPDAHAHLQTLSAGLTVKTEGLQPAAAENWGVSPATSDSNHVVASYLPFDDAEWRGQAELQEVVSALVAASAPPPPAVDCFDDLLVDIDIASYFA